MSGDYSSKIKSENYTNLGGINQKASLYITAENDCLSLENLCFVKPGSLTSTPGSALFTGVTVADRFTGLYEYEKLSGFSQIIFTANTTAYFVTNVSPPTAFRIALTPNAITDFVTFVDTLFVTNGAEFFKWDGVNSYTFSTPPGSTLNAITAGAPAAGVSGTFQYAYGYLNTNGYYSGVGARATYAATGNEGIVTGFTYPSGYGITAAVIYRTEAGGNDLGVIGYLPFGGATFVDIGYTLLPLVEPESVFFTAAPIYLDLFQNSLFLVGTSAAPSTAFFAEPGEPENIPPENNFEVRTNDGDVLTGSKYYNSALYLFKNYSFSKVVGNDSANFTLLDVSDQYGAVSNNAIIVFEDSLVFLDRNGVVKYDGATPKLISDKMEDTFNSMNLRAARKNAVAIHYRDRNEIWFAFPSQASEVNDTVVIYDYLANSWTTQTGYVPAALAMIKANFSRPQPMYGTYQGSLHYVSPALYNHQGNEIEYRLKTRFHNIFGPSNTAQYRRLFVDTDPIPGFTVPMTINFRVNEQDAIVYTTQIYLDRYQTRIDFGIPANSISMEFVASGASFPIRINGYTLEARLQRKV